MLQIAMKEANLRCREYYENHQDYLKFMQANQERVFPEDGFQYLRKLPEPPKDKKSTASARFENDKKQQD